MSDELAIFKEQLSLMELENQLAKLEQVDIPTTHTVSGGVYIREIFVPKGTIIIGKRHRHESCNIPPPQGPAGDRVLQHRWRTGHCLPARVGQRPGCLVAGTGPEFPDAKEVCGAAGTAAATPGLRVLLEPGRFISGNSGILITRVEYVKRTGRKNFVMFVDAAMNDLIRPAFYEAYHEIVPLRRKAGFMISSDVVGPVCESGDFFCKDRPLPKVGEGDYLALLSAGAYGFVMASNYNTRPLAAEVLVNGRQTSTVRERQSVKDIWAGEKIAPWLK